MNRIPVSEHIEYVVPENMKNFTACSGIIIRGKETCIIDTNMGNHETIEILEKEKPAAAIISHYHLDHSTWGKDIEEKSSAEIYIPRIEKEYLTSLDYFLKMTAEPFGLRETWEQFTLKTTNYRTLDNYKTYESGKTFDFGGVEVRAIATPGHSPGHNSFYFPEEEILFTGDLGIDRFGPWYGWVDCDLKKFVESVISLKSLGIKVLLTSHGGMITEGIYEALDGLLEKISDREEVIRQCLDAGKREEAIIEEGVFYGKKDQVPEPMRSFLYMWDKAMYQHHRALLDEGGIAEIAGSQCLAT